MYIISGELAELIEDALVNNPECKLCPHEGAGFKQGIASKVRANKLSEHDKKIREQVLDEFGILHGEDANIFQKYLNGEGVIDTPEGKELIKQAYEMAQKRKEQKSKSRCKFFGAGQKCRFRAGAKCPHAPNKAPVNCVDISPKGVKK